jgi:hypothetical protein
MQVAVSSHGPGKECSEINQNDESGHTRIVPKFTGWVEEQLKKYAPCKKAAPLVDCMNPMFSLPAAQKGRKVYLLAGGKANADEYCK